MGTIIEGSSRGKAEAMATAADSGDADFEAWLSVRQQWLFRTAYVLTGDRHVAEDLTQTALAKLYLAWPKIADREHVDAYARRVLVNEHRSQWRRAWRRREVTRDELPELPSHDREYDGADDAMWRFVATLPRRQRAVVVLRYYEGLSEAQTAEAMGISVGTVKSQCHKALARLRNDLAAHPEIDRGEDR